MKYKYWIPVIVMIIFIFSQSMLDGQTSENVSMGVTGIISNLFSFIDIKVLNYIVRKIAHFSEYAILGALVFYANYKSQIFTNKYLMLIILMIAIPCMDETVQYFSEGRSPQFTDILIDMSGMLTSYIIGSIIQQKRI